MEESAQLQDINKVIEQRLKKLEELRKQGINPYSNTFKPKHRIAEILEQYSRKSDEELNKEKPFFSVAGRIMALRSFGKSVFAHIQDEKGRIQIYFRKDILGNDLFKLVKKLDIGDIIGVEGEGFRTKTGEFTILVKNFQLLTKSLRPLPEKYHGLKNVEIRYRQRYVDLIVNQEVRNLFITRSKIIQSIRNFLCSRDFLEVETPMMQVIPGGATAKPFKTYHNALGMELFLRIAPELYLKRLLVGGFERVFEINRNFRNEGISIQHNPEFTMLEFYQAYATYEDLMDLTEQLFQAVAEEVLGKTEIEYQGNMINLKSPWERLTLADALVEIGKQDPEILKNEDAARRAAQDLDIQVDRYEGHGKLLTKIFDLTVEPKLIQPTFITHYPIEVSPLSRRNEEDPSVTDRFELFIAGREMANAFSELNDPIDQRERFLKQVEARKAGDEEAHLMDEDFIRALEYGMPPAAGEGIGIDRLVMLLTDSPSIREVILFPLLRPEKSN